MASKSPSATTRRSNPWGEAIWNFAAWKEYAADMKRPSKKDIKAALEKLKTPSPENHPSEDVKQATTRPPAKKSSQRIRKQGI